MIGVDQYSYILIIIRIPITVLQSSFAEIARLLSEFFRELDVVPSDVLAGLIMLRQRQQQARQTLINQVESRDYSQLRVRLFCNSGFIGH